MKLASEILTLLERNTHTLNRLTLSGQQSPPPPAEHCRLALQQLVAIAEATSKLAEVAHAETVGSDTARLRAETERLEAEAERLKAERELVKAAAEVKAEVMKAVAEAEKAANEVEEMKMKDLVRHQPPPDALQPPKRLPSRGRDGQLEPDGGWRQLDDPEPVEGRPPGNYVFGIFVPDA